MTHAELLFVLLLMGSICFTAGAWYQRTGYRWGYRHGFADGERVKGERFRPINQRPTTVYYANTYRAHSASHRHELTR